MNRKIEKENGKKAKLKKTLVDQILDKAKVEHDSLAINALEGDLPDDIEKSDIFKTLALTGDKTGPLIGIVQITEHLSEKKLAKVSGNKKVSMIPQKIFKKQLATFTEQIILSVFIRNTIFRFSLITVL